MKNPSRFLIVGVAVLLAAALASGAFARGGRGGGRGIGISAILCLSGTQLDRSLTTIDALIKTNGSHKTALDDLKKGVKDYSDSLSRACGGDVPMDIPSKFAASEKRLEAALTGIRKLKPLADKFYATLNDEQKNEASLFIDLPGL
jgi:ABC-type transporter Mla subunit MlaD